MIASHNTFSYLQPRHKIFNLFKGFWRCQDLDIKEQLASGSGLVAVLGINNK